MTDKNLKKSESIKKSSKDASISKSLISSTLSENPNDTDHLIIVDKNGTPWFHGGSSTNILSTEQPPVYDDVLEKTIPPNIAQIIKTNSKPQRGPPKMRASARYSAPPIHPIFKQVSEMTDDPFWKDVFLKMSKNMYRKGFRYTPNVAPFEGGKLVYRSKTKEYVLKISTDPEDIFNSVKQFMEKHVGMSSEQDQQLLNTLLIEQRKNPLEDLPKFWSHVKGYNSKNILISHYVDLLKVKLNLNGLQYNDLISTISLGIASGILGDGSISLHNGAIENIIGLMQDKDTGEFYFDIQAIEKASANFASYLIEMKNLAKKPSEGDEESTGVVTNSTVCASIQKNKIIKSTLLVSKSYSVSRDGNQTFVYKSSNTPSNEIKNENKELKTIPPTTLFSRTIEYVENKNNELLFTRYSQLKDVHVSTRPPTNEEIDEFINNYIQTTFYSNILPIVASAYGFINAFCSTSSSEEKLKISFENAYSFIEKSDINVNSTYISYGIQRLIDQIITLNYQKLIEKSGCSKIVFSDFESQVERHDFLEEKIKTQFKLIEDRFKNNTKESKYVKRAETLTYSLIDKNLRSRKNLIDYQLSELQTIQAASRPIIESVCSVGGGTANKPNASIKRWNRFVELIEKKLTERSIKNTNFFEE